MRALKITCVAGIRRALVFQEPPVLQNGCERRAGVIQRQQDEPNCGRVASSDSLEK